METIECKKCGSVMPPVTDDYTILPDVKVADSLVNKLKEHVNALRANPQYCCLFLADTDDNGTIAGHIHGNDYMIGTTNILTNKANLNLYATLKTEDEKERFNKLENSRLYTKDSDGSVSIECGEDAEMCSYLFSEIIQKVWGFNDELKFNDFGDKLTYDSVALYLNQNTDIWKTLNQMVKDYNAEAKTYNYPLFNLDSKERVLKGSLPSYLDKGGVLSKTHRTFKKMKNNFETIIGLALKNLAKE